MGKRKRHEWSEYALAELERAGYRAGGARRAVIDLLADQHCCLTAREIGDGLRERGSETGMASIYRALEVLDSLKLVQRLDTGEGTARYEIAHPSGEHHHHMVCDRCARVVAFVDENLERAIEAAERKSSFAITAHEIVLKGTCPECQKSAKKESQRISTAVPTGTRG